MEFINVKCKKCGYEVEIPELTESVVCGSCGSINHYSRISTILKKHNYTMESVKSREASDKSVRIPDLPVPDGGKSPVETESPSVDEDDMEYPEEKKVYKIFTVLFVLAPFIAMAVEIFNLPSYLVLVIIFLIVGIIFFLRR